MSLFELFLIAVGLSMDAFAVAVCKGLSMSKITLKKSLVVGLYFGIFQSAMPLIGYFLGRQFAGLITAYDHWVTFILLGAIGFNMIRESREGEEKTDASLSPRSMLPLAVATSIDALAVGISFKRSDRSGRFLYRCHYPDAVHGRRQTRKCFRRPLQVARRTGGRPGIDSARS